MSKTETTVASPQKDDLRIGVYVCHCGINIASTVDVAAVAEAASHLPGVVIARHYTYMCSDPGQDLIRQDIAEFNLNQVVVASCSPRMLSAPRGSSTASARRSARISLSPALATRLPVAPTFDTERL